MHVKRKTIPILWPVARTGTKYMAVSTHNKTDSIPLIIALRDILEIVKTKKELKALLNDKKVLINNKIVKEVNYPICLFDALSFPSIKKHFRAEIINKKMNFKEISEKESLVKIFKVIGKKILGNKKVQINLTDGKNIISSEKMSVGDFVVINNENKIIKIISLKKDVEVIAIKGKHIGKEGKIKELIKEGENSLALIVMPSKDEVKVNIKNLFAKL
jgi:small subunit ribosomal protein S4e